MILHHRIDGAGPPLVLLHPVGLDLASFDSLVGDLARSFRVIRIDLPGHGGSEPVPEPEPDLGSYAHHVHATIERLGCRPAAFAGFSFGGMIVQTLAIDCPEDVSAAVISACPSTLTAQTRAIALQRASTAERDGMAAVVEDTLNRWFSVEFRARGRDAAVRQRLLSDDPRGWADAWRAIAKLETTEALAAIRAPTLCLAAGDDAASPPDVVRRIADRIPGAAFAIVDRAPHMLFIERPAETAAAIVSFLSRVDMTVR